MMELNQPIQIDLNQIVNIGTIIDQNKLICSICFCISLEPMECMNKRCHKVYCVRCILVSKQIQNHCPFCRLNVKHKKCNDSIYQILGTMKVIIHENYSKSKLSISEYIDYKSQKPPKKLKCFNCKKEDRFLKNCSICQINTCNKCDNFVTCLSCKSNICKFCEKSICNNNKNELLCGYCTIDCKQCSNEGKYVCIFCQKILCNDCSFKCEKCELLLCRQNDCYGNLIKNCTSCSKNENNENESKCRHLKTLSCTCIVKCNAQRTTNCNILVGISKCENCKLVTCVKNCALKCKICKKVYCKACNRYCSACKTNFCSGCILSCHECSEPNNSFCINCNTDILKQCLTCQKTVCISCWNICNNCESTFCKTHIEYCINCEEGCCKNHFFNCEKCIKKGDSNYKKLCIKNCALQCSFCPSFSTVRCEKDIHSVVNSLNCGHNVCTDCDKKCAKCPDKVVLPCPTCIINYYFYSCKICNFYLCNVCSNFCKKCEELYCPYDLCLNCNMKVGCLCCNEIRLCECGKTVDICANCKTKAFCNRKCRTNYLEKYKQTHFCTKCNKCSKFTPINDIKQRKPNIALPEVKIEKKKESVECKCLIM